MLIAYDSATGNVKRFVHQTGFPAVQITQGLVVDEPFVLVTYTTGYGDVPQTTLQFLKKNHHNLIGVASSGNRNWGQNFAKSADIISKLYNVPIIHKFELFGTKQDVVIFREGVLKLYERLQVS